MTVTAATPAGAPPPPVAAPAQHVVAPGAPVPAAAPGAGGRERPAVRLAGMIVTLLGAVLLGFLVHVAVVGQLHHDRAQQTLFADFRVRLAEATAPVRQTDDINRPLALGTPVAVIEIPALGVWEVVVEGTTSGALQAGPGHRRDTVLPGQQGVSVIMARRAAYGGPFAGLARLNAGDVVAATTGQGTSGYRVRGVRRPGDPLPPPVAAGASRLTLVTADGSPFAPTDVVYVDADLVTPPVDTPPRAFGATALPSAERVMARDSGALLPLVLWGQGLLAAAAAVSWAAARWGPRQAWVVGVPLLAALGCTVADQVLRLLPNLL